MVARAGTRDTQPQWWRTHEALRSHALGHQLLFAWARLSRGLAHVSSAHNALACMHADRRLVVTRSAPVQRAHAATMVAHAGARCRPQPRWWRSPRGVARHNAIHSAFCCLPHWGGGLSARLPKFRSRGIMLRAGVGCSHNGGAARPQPQWWRDPTKVAPHATRVSPSAPLAAQSHRRQSMSQSTTSRWGGPAVRVSEH